MLLSVAIQRYLRHHRTSGSSAETLKWHSASLGQLLAHGGDKQLEELTADDLRDFLDALRARGLAQSTLAGRYRSPKAFGNWLVAEEYLTRNPFARVQAPKIDDAAPAHLTPPEVKRLLAAPDRATLRGLRDWAMMSLLYSTGLRAEELCNLKLADIDEGSQQIAVRRGKGGKYRNVPYSRPAERAVNRYLARRRVDSEWLFTSTYRPTQRLTTNALGRVIRDYGRQVGLAVHPHTLRHSFSVRFLQLGGSMADLQIILGHSDMKITAHYGRIAGVDIVRRHRDADPLGNL